MMQSALLLLLGAYTASAQTFVDGSFWIRASDVVACDNTQEVLAFTSAILALADTCLVDDATHSTFFNTTSGSTQQYANSNCSGDATAQFDWTCAGAEIDAVTVSYSYSTPSFRGDQVIWANYYESEDCSGDSYQYGSGAPSTVVAGQCTAYVRSASESIISTITERISDSQVQIEYYSQEGSLELCSGKPTQVQTYEINTCVAAPAGSPFGSLKIETSAATIPPFLTGQVNLNEDATNLNKQVAGASIGVLCGFTAVLICISMTGILG